jgi:hypothetical protein
MKMFFCEVTLGICSSFNMVEALKNCFDYLNLDVREASFLHPLNV